MRGSKLLFGALAMLGIANFHQAMAQLNFSDGFENGIIWTDVDGTYYTVPEDYGACSGNAIIGQFYYAFHESGLITPLISPSLGTSNGGIATLQYEYKVSHFGNSGFPLPNDPDWGTVRVEYSYSTLGPWMEADIISPSNHTPSADCATRTVTFVPDAGMEVFIRYTLHPDIAAQIDGDLMLDNVVVTQAPPCATPAPDALQTPQDLCNGATVAELDTAGFFIIQWYSSETGGQLLANDAPLTAGTYYATQIAEGEDACESIGRTAVTVTISTVQPPAIASPQVVDADTVLLYSVEAESDGTVTWYATQENAENGVDALPEDTVLTTEGTYYATQTVGTCESIPVAVEFEWNMGTGSNNFNEIRYYPNPVKNILTISNIATTATVTIYNVLGQEVMGAEVANGTQLDLSKLEDGTYILKVHHGEIASTIKIIKSR
ncbi:T9SS type A sorting domain-containing protein [Flavobacterium sp.]|uniref:T9SS type A sorting domain-containing protein n=1 Tax=Flavobacterium sp. TaxID=239 RepID=UPI004033E20D